MEERNDRHRLLAEVSLSGFKIETQDGGSGSGRSGIPSKRHKINLGNTSIPEPQRLEPFANEDKLDDANTDRAKTDRLDYAKTVRLDFTKTDRVKNDRLDYANADRVKTDREDEAVEEEMPGKNKGLENVRKSCTNALGITATLTNLEVLDCPICFENLTSSVFQCKHGHIACDPCRLKINKCPMCSTEIVDRCHAIEKILEAVEVSCDYMVYGCKEVIKFSEKREHEYKCIYPPCSCPIYECNFVGTSSMFYEHFDKNHGGRSFRFSYRFSMSIERNTRFLCLREYTSGTVFVLNVYEGSAVAIVVIAPNSCKGKYQYKLEAKSLRLADSEVECVQNLDDYCPTFYEYLPVKDLLRSLGQVELDICIRVCANEAKARTMIKK